MARSKLHVLLSVATISVVVLQAGAVGETTQSAAQSTFLTLEAEHSASAQFWFRVADWVWCLLLLGLLFGFSAVTTDRTQNSMLTVLSLPVTRGEYVAAKFFSYTGTFAVVLTVGCVLAGVGVALTGSVDLRAYVLATIALVHVGSVVVAGAVALSVVAPTRRFALTGAIVTFVVTALTAGLFALNSLPAASAHPFHASAVLVAAPKDGLEPIFSGFITSPVGALGAMYATLLAATAVSVLAIRRVVVH